MTTSEVPLAFRQYRELFKIHITHILTLEVKTPIHSVPLLVTVACEVLARLLGYGKGGAERVGSEELSWPSIITRPMTRRLFDVLRNGLAHAYGPYPFILQGGEKVRVTMTWKAGPHLKFIGLKIVGTQALIVSQSESELPGKWLCVDAGSLWEMLKAGFEKIGDRVKVDPKPARTIEKNASKLLKARPAGSDETKAAAEWQAFLEAAVYTPGASDR